MKNFKLFAIAIFTTVVLAACNDNLSVSELQNLEKEYSFDIRNAVNANYFETDSNEGAVTVKSNLPFEATILDRNASNWYCDPSTRPNFEICYDDNHLSNGKSYTRDILLHIRPLEICKIKGYGYFNYPVVIRQKGDNGALALTKAQVKAFNESQSTSGWSGENDQHYVVGKVDAITTVSPYAGAPANTGYYTYPLSPDQGSMYSDKAWNLEACDITVNVDGEKIILKAICEAPYGLVSEMAGRVKTGDIVEVNITNRGILESFNGIFVHPLSVRVQ